MTTRRMPLDRHAHARSRATGDGTYVGLNAYDDEGYEIIRREVTAVGGSERPAPAQARRPGPGCRSSGPVGRGPRGSGSAERRHSPISSRASSRYMNAPAS